MIEFGDHVRVKDCAETRDAGLAGKEGDVYGHTTPSVTGVSVVGGAPDDLALNVFFDELDVDHWIRPDLVEFIHFNVGWQITVGPIAKVRQADGSWREVANAE